ncbi:putative rhomboid protease YdcA [Halobacillus andaensis]|uniref:Rhomboid protease YdcA n=1 Tax=Halobacillus andaensis TaxID=1176239 RepID=A0A917BA44_HALAA|nr:rhomboid family intramembrane serine protease [Halobacillus andaensis]MBP2006198.1 membrane associated rhomboid family serine protease [Halobacillus andaensis]GGF33221.1 putative rhomboid protease YdcA [Halobacillus andaensis]
MFVRTESFQEFLKFYPIVSGLVAIHFLLWLFIDIIQLPIAMQILREGIGNNYLVGQGEYWRLVTPIFLHGGFAHALFNSFSLVLFGPALEQMLGKTKFILMYIAAGIAGNVGTYLMAPNAFYQHLGASGAIFGIFGVYLFIVLNRKSLIGSANTQIVMVIFVLGLFMTFSRPGINVWAHLFGLIGGFAVAPPLLRNVRPFSVWQNRAKFANRESKDIAFNPNRWSKGPSPLKKYGKYVFWGIIIFLIALAFVR